MRKLRVFIIAQEEPFYIPKVMRHILKNESGDYSVTGATVLSSQRKGRTLRDWFLERANVYTWHELLLVGVLFCCCKLCEIILRKGFYSVRNICKCFNKELISTPDINDARYLNKLRQLNIDIIVSISPPQIFGKALLNVPNKYCINAHGSLLPRHRGVFASWWSLYCEDKEVGGTVHTMVERLDAGKILWQKAFPTSNTESQYSIAYTTKKLLAQGIVETLGDICSSKVNVISEKYRASYRKAPTRKMAQEFHRRGLKIIKVNDIGNMLTPYFTI